MATRKFIDENALSHIALVIKQKYQAKELKTGSESAYKVLSDNNLTDELVTKINNAGTSSFSGSYNDLTNKPDLTVYAEKTQVATDISTAVADFLTATQIDNKISTATENMATTSSVATAISNALADYFTKTEINTKLADYAKSTEVTSAIETALATYYTKTETDNKITTALTPYAKTTDVNSSITNATRDFLTGTQIDSKINEAIADITSFEYSVVDTLPTTGVKGTIYLVPNGGSGSNVKDEYIYVDSKWEKIGTTEMDLSDYQKESELVPITNEEINTIFNA